MWGQDHTPNLRLTLPPCVQFSCCGYFTHNDTVEIGGTFCANQTFVDTLVDPNNTDTFRCVAPLTKFTDFTLNNIFT